MVHVNFAWSHAFKCSVKTHMTLLSTKCQFVLIYADMFFYKMSYNNQWLWDLELPLSPIFTLDTLFKGGFDAKHGIMWNIEYPRNIFIQSNFYNTSLSCKPMHHWAKNCWSIMPFFTLGMCEISNTTLLNLNNIHFNMFDISHSQALA
jgi:hypothetical protein